MGGGFGAAARDTFKYSGKVRPGKQSPKRSVPKSISKPDYWKDGQPKARGPMLPWQIQKKSEADIEGMRAAGRIAREVLDLAGAAVAPGAPRTRACPRRCSAAAAELAAAAAATARRHSCHRSGHFSAAPQAHPSPLPPDQA